MSWRFRKSFKVFPGARINISKRGLSATIGGSPISFNIGSQGAHVNLSIPGTGLSYRHKLSGSGVSNPQITEPRSDSAPMPSPVPAALFNAGMERQEIRSASTFELTSHALQELHRILTDVDAEQQKIDAELSIAGPDWQKKSGKYVRWDKGFLFKHLRKARFATLGEEAQTARKKLDELIEQRKLTRMSTEIQITDELKPPFGRVFDAFTAVAGSARIWDTVSTQHTNRFRERTTATSNVDRTPVQFAVGQSDLLQCEWKAPCLGNANGGDMYVYPGFLLYRISRQAFAIIDCREVSIEFQQTNFIEEEQVPPDAQVVGHTWKYANKNGSPDRRFSNNYQIPVALYGQISITSPTGLNERYLISNCRVAEEFAVCWRAFRSALCG